MKAVVQNNNGYCVAKWTGKNSFISVIVKTYCDQQINAGDGVLQVPDKFKVCTNCDAAIKKLEAQLP